MSPVLLIVFAIFFGLLLLLAFWAIALYNGLIGKRNRFRNAFAQIEVQLQRRYDLIPNLVETAKGYMSHEKDTLEAVIAARNQAMGSMQAAAPLQRFQCNGQPRFGRGRTWWRLGSIDGGRRSLSRPEGEPEHDGGARGTHQHRKQSCLCSASVQ